MVLAEEQRVATQTDQTSEIIRVEGLRRVFNSRKKGTVHAVRGVSWAANRGQVFGLEKFKIEFRVFWSPEGVCETKKRPQLHVYRNSDPQFCSSFFIFLVRENFSKKVVWGSFGI